IIGMGAGVVKDEEGLLDLGLVDPPPVEGLENTAKGDPTDNNMDEVTRNAIRMFCTLFG
ncbi:hypothetical protein PHISCL_10448, partial [Aspergillus sclerotialis]